LSTVAVGVVAGADPGVDGEGGVTGDIEAGGFNSVGAGGEGTGGGGGDGGAGLGTSAGVVTDGETGLGVGSGAVQPAMQTKATSDKMTSPSLTRTPHYYPQIAAILAHG